MITQQRVTSFPAQVDFLASQGNQMGGQDFIGKARRHQPGGGLIEG
jgi:hypothetical protein